MVCHEDLSVLVWTVFEGSFLEDEVHVFIPHILRQLLKHCERITFV